MRKTRSDKGTGAIKDRSEYNRLYGRIYRQQRKDGLRALKCECGGGVKGDGTPVKWIGSEGICAFCSEQEGFSKAQEIRQRRTLCESNSARDSITEYMRRLAMLPQWLRDWTENLCNTSTDIMMNRIESWVEDNGREIVVHGHGEYRLALQ